MVPSTKRDSQPTVNTPRSNTLWPLQALHTHTVCIHTGRQKHSHTLKEQASLETEAFPSLLYNKEGTNSMLAAYNVCT